MNRLRLIFLLIILLLLVTPAQAFQAGSSEPTQKQVEEDLKKLQRELELTKDTTKVSKIVAKIEQLRSGNKIVGKLSSLLGTISSSADLGAKLIKTIQDTDEDDRPKVVREKHSTLETYINAALDPKKELERVEAELEAIELPVSQCDDSAVCVTVDDILKNKKKAQEKAYEQNKRFEASIKRLEELQTFFTEMSSRASAAKKALEALSEAWLKAYNAGCGILGSYCGFKWLEADELAGKCASIRSAADRRLKEVTQVLKEEKSRHENWRGNMKDLFQIDVTKKP